MTNSSYDFDLIIIGAGYGGYDSAKHAAENGLKVAIIESGDMGGTCVNKGCVPSKALLAASGKVREIADKEHLEKFGIHSAPVRFERQKISQHAENLVNSIRESLTKSLSRIGVEIIRGLGRIEGANEVGVREKSGIDRSITASNILIASGSSPFIPPGIEIDGQTVFTSDDAVKLKWLPKWIAIIGSGYIGLEFADIYTALGTEVTMIEALENLMPTFDPDITKIAKKNLIQARHIETKTGVLATNVVSGNPVTLDLINPTTKNLVEKLEVDAVLVATGRVPNTKDLNLEAIGLETKRGFIPVNDQMNVLIKDSPQSNLWAVGDVTGKLMLAHTAAAQGVIAVDNILGKKRSINYNAIPAATFTHPEISSVGLSEKDAKDLGVKNNFQIGIVKSYFKANSKALAELSDEGLLKLIFRKDNGIVLGSHIYGLHAADLIQEISNAISRNQNVKDLSCEIHTHPTLSEVVEVAYKQASKQLDK